MEINFFEEFPDKKSLDKIKYIKFNTNLYIAAKSKQEFNKIKSQIKNPLIKKIIYWPILNKKDGYYLSPFSNPKSLKKILKECQNIPMLWDAEFPRKRILILKNLYYFHLNKYKINKFFKKNGKNVHTAEYNIPNKLGYYFLKKIGLSFNPKKYKNIVVKMVYNSLHLHNKKEFKKILKRYLDQYNKFAVGLGTIGVGINNNEPDIHPNILKRDLNLANELGVKEAIIFRLGGLNKEYAKIINNFMNNQ